MNHIMINNWKQVVESQCLHHPKFLAAVLKLDLTPSAADEISLRVLAFTGWDHLEVHADIKSAGKSRQFRSGQIYLLQKDTKFPKDGSARLVNPLWIDRSLLRQWKEKCLSSHGETCGSTQAQSVYNDDARPTWLIDVWRKCLVRPSQHDRYIALSYVWGGAPTLMARMNNIAELLKPLAFAEGRTSVPIPKTIRDAMSCVERLGERYLWVDSLCIVQDDPVHKEAEINKMVAIYSNAFITITASDGLDADSGLPGLSGLTEPRAAIQVVHTLRPGIQIVECLMEPKNTKWRTRGWTYQEEVFPRRQIFFEGGWARWVCQSDKWAEVGEKHGGKVDGQIGSVTSMRDALSSPIPDPYVWWNMIGAYNMRDLTYPEDALSGFAGILNSFGRSFDGGFISGLPAAMFYIAILWHTRDPLTRRRAKGSSGNVCLPSWSWIGWKGTLLSISMHPSLDFVKVRASREGARYFDRVTPLVQWHWRESLMNPGIPIRDTWYEYRQKYAVETQKSPCPSGWTRYSVDTEIHSGRLTFPPPELDNSPKFFYKHISEPESEFWYPVPIPDPSQIPKRHVAAPFISCRTKRAFLYGSEVITPQYIKGTAVISLRDKKSAWIGAIRLQEESTDNGRSLAGQEIELVEVALGRVPNDARQRLQHHQVLDEWDHEERPKNNDMYEYYYVLWVEWIDGVAYRKALGRVERSLWEAQERQDIDLVLG